MMDEKVKEVGVATCVHSTSNKKILIALYATSFKVNERGMNRMNYYHYLARRNRGN
jgi:hypothetical protein